MSEREREREREPHLLGEQHRGVAVFAVGLGAQRGQTQQEQEEGGAPQHQLPVGQRVQECVVTVQELREGRQTDDQTDR